MANIMLHASRETINTEHYVARMPAHTCHKLQPSLHIKEQLKKAFFSFVSYEPLSTSTQLCRARAAERSTLMPAARF